MCILRLYCIHLSALLAVVTGFTSNLHRPRLTLNTFRGKNLQPLALSAKLEASPTIGINGALESEQNRNQSTKKKVAVLLCPAQFCVPVDYAELLDTIQSELTNVDVVATKVAPLPRTEWIKVAKQLPTKNFIDANLSVKVTLDWYFDAIESALTELFAEGGDDTEICIIGHSIGGWVARAYLGGLSGSSTSVYRLGREQIKSLVTIGTPHISPESALVDQTRGLLREIATSDECSSQALSERGVTITCVGSSSLAGKLITTDVEELIAATSYLPLVGKLGDDVKGDGIVPTELAFMESPARRVEIEKCSLSGCAVRHAHVLPTPWNLVDGNAASIKLPEDILWYGSPGVLSQWLKYIK
mmetsp:Transcript_29444/g.43989  ORF Transcript_29444/g.43989 Transcript_29444/m.43989 type:complete len:359 (-) Transcript_29444:85-1161(-)